MEPTIADQLILTRDIEQLQKDKSAIEDSLERRKREALAAMDLVKKETLKLKEIQDLQVKIHDQIRESQIAWNAQKRQEEEELENKKSEVTKILNKENYIKLESQKLLKTNESLVKRENENAEEKKGFIEREEKITANELKAEKIVKEAELLLKTNIDKAQELKEKFLTEINKW